METVTREVHAVVPAGIDDPDAPSGGNLYDRRVCSGLAADGRSVHERPIPGAWPHPDARARAALEAALAAVPDGGAVLLDGLVACGVPEVVVPHARRLALVVIVHLPIGDEAGAAAELVVREHATLRAARAVVATSPWAARRLRVLHELDASRVTVATPGVDPAPPSTGRAGALLCVGSITPTKGQDLLVEALARVAHLPWTCDLVGPLHRDPAHVAAVRRSVDRHGLGDRVRLTGPLTRAELAMAYGETDLLVVPSRAETYGMVATEALARGIPVLAAAAGGLPETLGHDPDGRVPGLLVPPGDPAALGLALHGWLTDPAARIGLRACALKRRGMLDGWEVTSRCVASVLDRLPGLPG
jgi:glycosyltransferase involved in cell wall biosynthesis